MSKVQLTAQLCRSFSKDYDLEHVRFISETRYKALLWEYFRAAAEYLDMTLTDSEAEEMISEIHSVLTHSSWRFSHFSPGSDWKFRKSVPEPAPKVYKRFSHKRCIQDDIKEALEAEID